MEMNRATYLLMFVLFLPLAKAQEINSMEEVNAAELGEVADEFQELFFEALKQKGIENYDKAIVALDQCINLRPQEAILYFEKGKNEASLGNTLEAENNYLKALQLKPGQRDIMESLYEVYFARQDLDKASDLLKDLAKFDLRYKEDLARIYVRKEDFKKALAVLDELDAKLGKDAYRDEIRKQAVALSGGEFKEQLLLDKIKANPLEEQNYLNLIFVYSEQGKSEQAYKTAQSLLKINPEADEVHLALYKFYLEERSVTRALQSLKTVMESTRIEAKAKHSLLNDFLIFTERNPEYQPELEEAIALFSEKEQTDVSEELGAYYLKNQETDKALSYYEAAYQNKPADLEVLKKLALLRIESGQTEAAVALCEEALSFFPAQPLFYLLYGVGQNERGKFQDAASYLEMGIDYVAANPKMEADFYRQLVRAYTGMGDAAQAAAYQKRLQNLNQ